MCEECDKKKEQFKPKTQEEKDNNEKRFREYTKTLSKEDAAAAKRVFYAQRVAAEVLETCYTNNTLPNQDDVLYGLCYGSATDAQQAMAAWKIINLEKMLAKLPDELKAALEDPNVELRTVGGPQVVHNPLALLREILEEAKQAESSSFPDPTAPVVVKPKKETVH